jgi:alanine dehydrogenase
MSTAWDWSRPARATSSAGHEVLVESGAGNGIGVDDAQFRTAGAAIAANAAEVFQRADLVVKVKEPQAVECEMLRKDQVLFTYLHLAADAAQARAIMKSGATAIAYETVTSPNGSLPLLTPMSEVAGRVHPVGAASCEGQRRLRDPAGRGAGRAPGESGDPRGRGVGHARCRDGRRHARGRDHR